MHNCEKYVYWPITQQQHNTTTVASTIIVIILFIINTLVVLASNIISNIRIPRIQKSQTYSQSSMVRNSAPGSALSSWRAYKDRAGRAWNEGDWSLALADYRSALTFDTTMDGVPCGRWGMEMDSIICNLVPLLVSKN